MSEIISQAFPIGLFITFLTTFPFVLKDAQLECSRFFSLLLYEEESKSNLNIFLLTEYVQIGLKTLRHFST